MISSSSPKVQNEFSSQWYVTELKTLFLQKVEKVDCVIALSRAAPRLLEVCDLLSIDRPIYSELAISYLPKDYFNNKVVLLFDDSVVYGSTMAAVRSRLMKLGATIECLTVVVDRKVFLGMGNNSMNASIHLKTLNTQWVSELSSNQIKVFHNSEVFAFQRIGKPYAFDYPIFTIQMNSYGPEYSSSKIAELLGETKNRRFFRPFIARQTGRQLEALSIPVHSDIIRLLAPEASKFVTYQPYSKLRLYLDFDSREVRFVSMIQIDTNNNIENLKLADSQAQEIWEQIIVAVDKSGCEDKYRRFALHRGLVFILSVGLSRFAWHTFLYPSLKQLLEGKSPVIDVKEPTLMFGMELTEAILPLVALSGLVDSELNKASDSTALIWTKYEPEFYDASDSPYDLSLWKEINDEILDTERNPDALPLPNRDALANLAELLPVFRHVIDMQYRRTNRDLERLEKGLTFGDLLKLLCLNNSHCSTLDLSFVIDVFVDSGALVPQLSLDLNSLEVRRIYRSGENFHAERNAQLKSIVLGLLTERKNDGKPFLSEKGFSKVFALLRKLYPSYMPYSSRIQTYGVEPYVDDTVLRQWCEEHGILDIENIDNEIDSLD